MWVFFFFFLGGGVSDPICLSSSALHFFQLFFFGSTTLLTGMTGNPLHLQRPLTSQSKKWGFIVKENLNFGAFSPFSTLKNFTQKEC
jgi:hypothetical protein